MAKIFWQNVSFYQLTIFTYNVPNFQWFRWRTTFWRPWRRTPSSPPSPAASPSASPRAGRPPRILQSMTSPPRPLVIRSRRNGSAFASTEWTHPDPWNPEGTTRRRPPPTDHSGPRLKLPRGFFFSFFLNWLLPTYVFFAKDCPIKDDVFIFVFSIFRKEKKSKYFLEKISTPFEK